MSLAILLAEAIVRIFLPQNLIYNNDAIWKPDSKFGWRHRENINERINFGVGEVGFRTDENGFRIDVNSQIYSDSQSQNILVLGDSFLEAVQVENSYTVPQVLRNSLNQSPNLNTHFYNSAVAGWGPDHYLMEGQRVLKENRLKIDQVLVFLYVGNDVIRIERESFNEVNRNQNQGFRIPRKFGFRELASAIVYPLNDYLETRSHLFLLIKRQNKGVLTKLGISGYYFPDIFLTENKNMTNWETTTRVCKKISNSFRVHNIPVSFVLIPTTYQVNESIMTEYIEHFDVNTDSVDLEQPNKILRELFARDSLQLYDPLDFFKAKTDNGSILYGLIDTHFNAEGHAAMAEFLSPLVRKQFQNIDMPIQK
jgi:lysophospholipase L1-like esterase